MTIIGSRGSAVPYSSVPRVAAACVLIACGALTPAGAWAQAPAAATFQLPTVTVTAQKEPADAQTLPIGLTGVAAPTLRNAGVGILSDAGIYSPNTFFTEFSARKLSSARMRGIGASPANPSITTFFDGVPQLNANSANLDLLDVQQVEFVRGPQSTLFGRNSLGGVINVTSVRPPLDDWSGSVSVPFANYGGRDVRGSLAGPIVDGRLGVSASLQYGQRDGFTVNQVTGNAVDSREAFAAKGQVLWVPAPQWEARVIVTGERDRDGDYALNDLGALRQNPYQTMRDYEGFTHRDVFGTTVVARREGGRLALTSTTGFLRWQTEDSTDLDYSPLPLIVRNNLEESFQFTQEVRVASSAAAPVRLGERATLRWQAGLFLFTQNYDQNAANTFSPFVLSPLVPFAVTQTSPQAALDDVGVGIYGQGTATLGDRVDLTAGLRFDYEQKDAVLDTFFSPPVAPGQSVAAGEGFSNVSPQFAASVRLRPGAIAYASVAGGYKAGGFNPASPVGSESYGEEHTWSVEGGVKTSWAGERVTANASVFSIAWDDLQLNVPNPFSPAQFYIANVGGASSRGVELEVMARLLRGLDVFGGLGYTHARFGDDAVSSGVPVGGNRIPNTPDYTVSLGAQLAHELNRGGSIYARAEAVFYGAFDYDDLNSEGQEAYSVTNLRLGIRSRFVSVEGWIRNAFDTHYIPVAFAYGALAPSGFVGEMGRPRTFGISAGVGF